jgi:hypothetical protein
LRPAAPKRIISLLARPHDTHEGSSPGHQKGGVQCSDQRASLSQRSVPSHCPFSCMHGRRRMPACKRLRRGGPRPAVESDMSPQLRVACCSSAHATGSSGHWMR